MRHARILLLGMTVWLGTFEALSAQEATGKRSARSEPAAPNASKTGKLPLPVGLETLPANSRDTISKIMQAPTLTEPGEICR